MTRESRTDSLDAYQLTLDSRSPSTSFSGGAIGVLIVFCTVSTLLLTAGHKDYPDLHTILDTGAFLLSGMLAFHWWNMGANVDRTFLKWLGASFAVTSLLEFLHVIVVVE